MGASLAGGTAAAALREEGFDGRVVLIGAEEHPPYERPPLSKQYLRGEQPFEVSLVHAAGFYADNGIETRFGTRATRVDTADRVVELELGDRVPYDKVLIATGGRNRRSATPGLDLAGVIDLRTVEQADRIRAEVAPGRKAVVVGMGFIGAEVAASLRQSGVDVTVAARSKAPLDRVLGEDVGRVLEGIHRDHGVDMLFEDSVAEFRGSHRVEEAVTERGRRVGCDFAVVGVGIEPATEVASGTNLTIENGIVVDEYCRANNDGVFAAGDVANHHHPVFGRRIRVEHWQNARRQGAAAALSMIGKGRPYDEVHWFWSDQYDHNLQYAGFHTDWDELVVRGSLKDRDFSAFYVKDRRIQAVVALGRGADVRRAMPLIRSRAPVDAQSLGDERLDLRSLHRGSAGQLA